MLNYTSYDSGLNEMGFVQCCSCCSADVEVMEHHSVKCVWDSVSSFHYCFVALTNLIQSSRDLSSYKVKFQFTQKLNRYQEKKPPWFQTQYFLQLHLNPVILQCNPAKIDVIESGIRTNLMEVIRLLMESETVLEWPARMDQLGGSLGLRTSERAVSIR